MRVLLLSHGYPPTVSGVSLVVQKLARALVGNGHEVAVVTASDRRRPYRHQDAGVSLYRLRSFRNPVWSEGPIPAPTLGTLLEIVAEFRPDVIHTHDNVALGIQIMRLGNRLNAPMVASCHALPDFVAQFVPQGGRLERWVVGIMWRYLVWHLNHFDMTIFPTQVHRGQFLEHGLRAPSGVISNGVDLIRYHPPRGREEDVESRYNLPAGPRILFVGRLCRDKNIDILIRAMPAIWAQRRAHLLLVGRGDERPALEEMVRQVRVSHCVHLLGYLPEEDLPAIYRAADLFAIASTVEVQSIPTLQALVSALPVLAADAGALPELVQNDHNGYLVPPNDIGAFGRAAAEILGDPERARRFGRASMGIGRRHEEGSTFRAFMDMYHQLLASWWVRAAELTMPGRRPAFAGRRKAPLSWEAAGGSPAPKPGMDNISRLWRRIRS